MSIEFNPGNFSIEEILSALSNYESTHFNELYDSFAAYKKWIRLPGVSQLLPWNYDPLLCPHPCSTFEDCKHLYSSFYGAIANVPEEEDYNYNAEWAGITPLNDDFLSKLLNFSNFDPARKTLYCPFLLSNGSTYVTIQLSRCPPLNPDDWVETLDSTSGVYGLREFAGVDNLRTFVRGGVDSDGIFHEGLGNASLASKLREFFLGDYPSNCTLESVCESTPHCKQVGTRLTASPRKEIQRSAWAYFVLTALANINQQMFNQFETLQSAAIEDSLTAFNIDDYFPEPGKSLALKNIITGLSTVLAAVSGFIPFIGPGLVALEAAGATAGALGAIASGAGVYFERALQKNVDRSDPNIAQKRFAPIVRQVFRVFSESLDNIKAELLRGERIDGTLDVYDMMRGGAWVDRSALSRIPYLQEQVYK